MISSLAKYRIIFENLKKERRLVIATLFLSILGAGLEGIGIGLVVPFLEGLLSSDGSAFRTGWVWFDEVVLQVDASRMYRLYHVSGLILATVWLRVLVGYASEVANVKMSESVLLRLRRAVADQLLSVSLRFYSTTQVGELINTLTAEVQRTRQLFNIWFNVTSDVFLLIAYLGATLFLSWQLALIAIGLCAILFVVINPMLRSLLAGSHHITEANGQFASTVTELVSGIRTVTAFGAQDHEREKFEETSRETAKANIYTTKRSARIGPLSQGIASTSLILLMVTAVVFFVMPGHLTTPTLFAFMFALMRLLPVARSLNASRAQMGVVQGSLTNLNELLREEDKPYLEDGDRVLQSFDDEIRLENVSFSYEPGQPVIQDVSATIKRGTITALVGLSGSGKSTLADLIVRFYDPNEGTIYVDGIDIRDYKIASLRDKISIVSQDTFLFNDSVRNNIAYALPEATEDQIREAARKAHALEFVSEMEDGFDTFLGDRGVRLSGGQRQRIAIARAILRDPEILILDEATSSLDTVSERLVQKSLDYLMQNRTVITIAHRLSTIENADKVLVLEEGRVVERGSYHELLARNGRFSEFHNLQQSNQSDSESSNSTQPSSVNA